MALPCIARCCPQPLDWIELDGMGRRAIGLGLRPTLRTIMLCCAVLVLRTLGLLIVVLQADSVLVFDPEKRVLRHLSCEGALSLWLSHSCQKEKVNLVAGRECIYLSTEKGDGRNGKGASTTDSASRGQRRPHSDKRDLLQDISRFDNQQEGFALCMSTSSDRGVQIMR